MRRFLLLIGAATVAVPFLLLSVADARSGQSLGARHSRGQIVFPSNRAEGNRELYIVNPDGSGVRRLTFNDVFERRPVWSPDKSEIAFSGRDTAGQWDLYVVNADGSGLRRLTNDSAFELQSSWTASGTQIVFTRDASPAFNCPCEAWIINADGSDARKIDTGPGDVTGVDTAPYGRLIAFGSNARGSHEIYVQDISGAGRRRLTEAPSGTLGDFYPRWSPDGARVAFLRDVTGTDNDVYVTSLAGGLSRLTNTPTFVEGFLSWSPDGATLIVGSKDGAKIATVGARLGDASPDIPTVLSAPLVETFSQGLRDSSVWHEIVFGPGTTIGEVNGGLQVSIGAGAVAGGPFNVIEGHWGMQCSMGGDYDVQVDYILDDWPRANGVQTALSAFFTNVSVERESQAWGEQYFAWLGGPNGAAQTLDRSGALRLVRSAGIVTAYFRSDGTWMPLVSDAATPGDAVLGIGAGSDNNRFAHQPVRVTFDNFRVSSGAFTCPSYWDAGAGDWR